MDFQISLTNCNQAEPTEWYEQRSCEVPHWNYEPRVHLHPKGVPVYTCIHAVLGVACIHAVYTHLKYMECQHGQVTSNLLLQYTNDTIALRCCHDHVGSSVASTCATNTWPAPPLAVALVVDTRSAMGIVYGSESFTSCTLSRSD